MLTPTVDLNTIILSDKIKELKQEKNAVILAHYYQESAIQEVADFIGDSLELSRKASRTGAKIILFAGVHFMAETAKILNPGKKVLVPDLSAGCSLADGCPPNEFREFINCYPEHTVITYINCSAEVKAMSDIICTSGNALKIINSLPADEKIIFAPDKNLGKYLIKQTGRPMILWEGTCEVHREMDLSAIKYLKKQYPASKLIAHPECSPDMLAVADFTGSTSEMLKFTVKDKCKTFIVVTEVGILSRMKKMAPEKKFIEAPTLMHNQCACSECKYMKKNTLQKLFDALHFEEPEIHVDPFIAQKAAKAIYRMLEY